MSAVDRRTFRKPAVYMLLLERRQYIVHPAGCGLCNFSEGFIACSQLIQVDMNAGSFKRQKNCLEYHCSLYPL